MLKTCRKPLVAGRCIRSFQHKVSGGAAAKGCQQSMRPNTTFDAPGQNP